MICGSVQLDFQELEKVTTYEGYERSSAIIGYFWDLVLLDMTVVQQKQLLFFATGSDRVPVGGLGKLTFVISKNGGDSDRLPTSHTCYNVLMLPDYSSKENLKARLYTALENSNCGFFLL